MITFILLAFLTAVAAASPAADAPLPNVDRYGDPLPAGSLARLGTIRYRAGHVNAAGLSEDGKTLRVLSVGPVLRTWDAESGRLTTATIHEPALMGQPGILLFNPVFKK